MPFSLIVHISDEDPVVGEAEELPEVDHFLVRLTNPRRLDGKALHYITPGVSDIFLPMHRVSFIELVPSDEEEIIGFVRE
ncbi:MAG TPA: hypothetical protein VMN57_06060 [Anaerolineales bacterium]|nr:hypothetical protein [Anaerolineales bacterium]